MKDIKERKKAYDKKFKKITIRVSPEQYDKIKKKADTLNLTPTTYLRYLAINKRLPQPIADLKMIAEVNKIGKNFNQITKKINAGFKVDKRFVLQLEEIKKQLETIIKKIER